MTTLLQRAVAELQKLSAEDQDAIASRLLAEVEDERQWSARFGATTDDQWDRIVGGPRPGKDRELPCVNNAAERPMRTPAK